MHAGSAPNTMLKYIAIKDYKSVHHCDVELQQLQFIVGANGVGKSNFLDAIRFLSDASSSTLDQAVRSRGGGQEIKNKLISGKAPIGIRATFDLGNRIAIYALEFLVTDDNLLSVIGEECWVQHSSLGDFDIKRLLSHDSSQDASSGYFVRNFRGERHHRTSYGNFNVPVDGDALLFPLFSGLPTFTELRHTLQDMHFYNVSPTAIRSFSGTSPSRALARSGANLASILKSFDRERNPDGHDALLAFLRRIVPGLEDVEYAKLESGETIRFWQSIGSASKTDLVDFLPRAMSDGTLRSLAILVALFQGSFKPDERLFLAIEEPEKALHPGAASILLQAMEWVSDMTQILITTHSPDLLDGPHIKPDQVLSASWGPGGTYISAIPEAAKDAIVRKLYLAGELLQRHELHHESVPPRVEPISILLARNP